MIDLLETTVAPAIENAVVKALTRVGERSPGAIAEADRSALSSLDAVLDRVETLEAALDAQPWHHDENVAGAARRLRSLTDDDI